MSEKLLSEQDIRYQFIDPALKKAGWDDEQVQTEFTFTDGRIILGGDGRRRGSRKQADYLLSYKRNLPLAVIEAKSNKYGLGHGMQQARDYADILDVPFVFSSNGKGFLFYDKTNSTQPETELKLDELPSPETLYNKWKIWRGVDSNIEPIVTSEYHPDEAKPPRYYQRVAINKAVEAVAKGQQRIMLVMATGTGKTLVASQIIWRLWKSGAKKRVLFLADRNILVDQTMTNDFKAFDEAMHKISGGKIDKAYEIYLSLYQAIVNDNTDKQPYQEFSPDFFDLIIIDECHRGSAKEDSVWRKILEYFSSATQIGMTATPKETKEVSNTNYFGEPIYTYSLKQGIDDGYLAPYKVVRVTIDKDVEGYRPAWGELDKQGKEIPDDVYKSEDFDRRIVIDDRTKLVAQRITDYMNNSSDRFMKTIVFCIDSEHASRMRSALVNVNGDMIQGSDKYVVRITSDDKHGKRELDNFLDPESVYPVIVTTAQLLSTGVDSQTCKLIVLDKNIRSMTEFKQIIGRGTRLKEDMDKRYFSILDFRRATDKFADPEFDGDPEIVYEAQADDEIKEPMSKDEDFEYQPADNEDLEAYQAVNFEEERKQEKVYVDGVPVKIINEQELEMEEDGKLVTKGVKDFTKANILKNYSTLDDFLNKWRSSDRKKALLKELRQQGILFDELAKEVGVGKIDVFDLILHVAYGHKTIFRKDRAEKAKADSYFDQYGQRARNLIFALIDKYADEGIEHIEDPNVLKVQPFSDYGTLVELLDDLGGREGYHEVIKDIENRLYSEV